MYQSGIPLGISMTIYEQTPKKTEMKFKKMGEPAITDDKLVEYIKLTVKTLTGIAYENRNQICDISVQKVYGAYNYIEIEVYTL
jgi:Holliday junction resolvase RusA-like endonuclease